MSASDSEPESHDYEGPDSAAQREITRLQEALARREAEAADQAEQHRRAIAERDAHDSEQFLEERRREIAREDRAREREDAFRRERKEAEDERHRLEEENARQQKMLDSPRFLELPSDSQEPAASAPPHQCDLPTDHLVRDHQRSQPSPSQDRTERIRTPAPNITTEDIRILIEQLGPEETVIANGLQQRMEDLLQLQQQRSGTHDTAHVTSDRREARNRTRGTRDQDPRRRSGNHRSSTERPGAPENHIRGSQVPLVPTGGTQSQVPIGGTQPQDPIVGTQPQDPTSAAVPSYDTQSTAAILKPNHIPGTPATQSVTSQTTSPNANGTPAIHKSAATSCRSRPEPLRLIGLFRLQQFRKQKRQLLPPRTAQGRGRRGTQSPCPTSPQRRTTATTARVQADPTGPRTTSRGKGTGPDASSDPIHGVPTERTRHRNLPWTKGR